MSDLGLISGIRRGDETAAAELYDRFAEPLLALAYRILGDRSDAEDVVLEALARVWRRADEFNAQRGSVRAWLTVTVRSRAIDLLRAQQRRGRLHVEVAGEIAHAGSEPSSWDRDPAQQAEANEERQLVRAALAELPPAQREAIALAYFCGLTQSEIAQRLGTPLGTVKTRIRDGMQKLRTALRPLYSEATT